VDIHEGEGISAAEVIMTQLHAGGKFDQNSYKVSGGLHGVGVSVVNALSEWLKLKIYRGGKSYEMEFRHGDAVVAADRDRRRADARERPAAVGHRGHLPAVAADLRLHRLRPEDPGAPAARAGVPELRRDHLAEGPPRAEPFEEVMHYEGGIEAFVRHLDKAKTPLIKSPIVVRGKRENVELDLSLWWNDGYHENVLCFTNNIPQRDGGTHLAAFRSALTRIITNYAESSGAAKREKVSVSGEDAREGLTCVLSVKVPDPKFSSQTKDKLVSSEVRPAVEGLVGEGLASWFEEHPIEARLIVQKIAEAGRGPRGRAQGPRTHPPQVGAGYLVAARQARRLRGEGPGQVRRSSSSRGFRRRLGQAGPQPRQPGDPASAGKILNVERARFDKMLGSEQIGTLIMRTGRRHRPRRRSISRSCATTRSC
jgi:DNA gyrase subunit B